ncbi:hypothetical protein HPP92_003038 [Vanilla planifolia]|uniref:Transcriptional coactivator Hfi1/Transcriptional adapter 1 n=1 Tax=Vanilla planifolia TaxID=51239 RepID=A0A835S7I1_VANPL|nr:hypothetical protein HPP92_003038 [Vanilla planifolia]
MPTSTPQIQGRINLGDIKLQIEKQLGPERTQLYFNYLSRLLAQKLSKPEFNRFCLHILGRENIPLHNQLISSILKNAYQGKTPPPLVVDKIALNLKGAIGKKLQTNDSLSQFETRPPNSLIHCNGDALSPSPRKSRTAIDQKSCAGPHGLNGRIELHAHQSFVPSDEYTVKENGILGPCDWKRPLQQHQGGHAEQPTKRPRTENSSLHLDQASQHGEKIAESKDVNSTKTTLQEPLGILYKPTKVSRMQRCSASASSTSRLRGNFNIRELCHTEDLRNQMEKLTEVHGLGVTLDCANLLNNALDAYLKRLILPSIELARARSTSEQIKNPFFKQHGCKKLFNGIWPGNHMHVQGTGDGSMDDNHLCRKHCMISLQDFKVAMELNPQQLGENWPLLLEKICMSSFEE